MVGQGEKRSVKQLLVHQRAFHHSSESQANEGRGLKFHEAQCFIKTPYRQRLVHFVLGGKHKMQSDILRIDIFATVFDCERQTVAT